MCLLRGRDCSLHIVQVSFNLYRVNKQNLAVIHSRYYPRFSGTNQLATEHTLHFTLHTEQQSQEADRHRLRTIGADEKQGHCEKTNALAFSS